MQILPTGFPARSINGVSDRAYSMTPSETRSPGPLRVRSPTMAPVARGFRVDAITPAGVRNRNSLLVASLSCCATSASTR